MDLNAEEQLELDQQDSAFQDFQHLNIDLCLELIFPYLELNDLANAADTCQQMKRAAELVFAHKYRKNLFAIGENKHLPRCRYKCDNKSIFVSKPKICFQILRSFGHAISELYLIYYDFTDPLWTQLDEYVKKYCANVITRLEILGRKRSFDNLQISFPNVEKVLLLNCKLDQFITKFNERFPKMRSLLLARDYFLCTEIDDKSFIIPHIPQLEHLSVFVSHPYLIHKLCGFREETVLSILKLNPNIRRLNLCSDGFLSEQFIRSINETCKSLDILQITGSPLKFVNKIHFKSVKMFTIQHQSYAFDSPIPLESPIPLTFDALEIFKCSFVIIKPIIFDFIRNNPTIVKLSLSSYYRFAYDEIIEMKKSFMNVKEIEYIYECISTTDITNILESCDSLQRLILKVVNQDKYYELIELTKSLENVAVIIERKEKAIILQK